MFAEFSTRLYEAAAKDGYRLTAQNGAEISGTTHWVAEKVEMATLAAIHAVDTERVDLPGLFEYDKTLRDNAEKLLRQISQVANVYILAGGDVPDFEGCEEYFGQPVYSVFWHLNLHTGEITVPAGQPKKLFNIRDMVKRAWSEANAAAQSASGSVAPASFEEITRRVAPPQAKARYRHSVVAYAVIAVNVLILGLMYIAGYQAGPEGIEVATRFGAIRADLVIYGGQWHRLFTAMFLHFGPAHLFANAMGILIFGLRLERYLGRWFFIITYIVSGLLGSVFSLVNLHLAHPLTVSAGASGAVYGLVGAIFIYTRITKRTIEFISWYVMLIYILIGMAMGFATPGIDNFAHIGGLIGGMIVGGVYATRSISKNR